MVKNPPAMQENPVPFCVGKMGWRTGLPTPLFLGFRCGSADKESAYNAGDLSRSPALGRFPIGGKGYPFQYSGLENSMAYIFHGVAKSRTRLSNSQFKINHYGEKTIFQFAFRSIFSLENEYACMHA